MSGRKGLIGSLFITLSAGFICTTLVPTARANSWTERSEITFRSPVEVPGHVLPAGTYTFQLLNSPSERNVVLIFNKNQTKLDAIIMAIPAYRLHPTSRTVVTFAERPVGTPEAVRTWFYPGMNYGQRFVYPHPRNELAMKDSPRLTARG